MYLYPSQVHIHCCEQTTLSCVVLLQGLDHAATGLNLVSNIIRDTLGIPDVSVLMGANLAKEVAKELFGEATIGMLSTEHLLNKFNIFFFYLLLNQGPRSNFEIGGGGGGGHH